MNSVESKKSLHLRLPEISRRAAMQLVGVAPEDIPKWFVPLLSDCCEVIDVDGACLFVMSEDRRFLHIHQVWNRRPEPGRELPQHSAAQEMPGFFEAISGGQPYELSASAFSAKPFGTEAEIFEMAGIKSMLAVPIVRDNVTLAALALVNRRQSGRWTEEAWNLLNEFGTIFGRLLARLNPVTNRLQDLRSLIGGDTETIFQVVIDSLNEGVSCCDNSGLVIYANPSWERITGFTFDEIRGKRMYEFLFPPDSSRYQGLKTRQHERYEERRKGLPEEYETEILTKDGDRRWIQVKASPLRNKSLEVVGSIGIISDVTDRKLLEDQLFWSQKAGGIGHIGEGVQREFENLFTVISGHSELLARRMSEEDHNQKSVHAIRKASKAAGNIARQLMTVSKKQSAFSRRIFVHDFMEEMLPVLQGLAGSEVKFNVNLSPSDDTVNVDEWQLQQVLINLMLNAKDAISGTKVIRISTQEQELERSPFLVSSELQPGRYTIISVINESDESRNHPGQDIGDTSFLSTKGEAVGPALSVACGIVRKHGGIVVVDSKSGKRSAFHLYLPLVDHPLAHAHTFGTTELGSGTQPILVAESDPVVRSLLQEILTDAGFPVVIAEGGLDALRILRNSPQPFSIVVLDPEIPVTTDSLLLDHLMDRDDRSNEDVSFISERLIVLGDIPYRHANCADTNGPVRCLFLKKPFTPEILLESVDLLLSAGTPRQVNE